MNIKILPCTLLLLALSVGCENNSSDSKEINYNQKIDIPQASKKVTYPNKTRLEYLHALSVRLDLNIKILADTWLDSNNAVSYKQFMSDSVQNTIGTLMQNCIMIIDEIVWFSIDDPIREKNPALVESAFSWNTSADIYNSISGIKKVWESGLSKLAYRTGSDIVTLTNAIENSLLTISIISNLDTPKVVLGTHEISQENAFRSKMLNYNGNKKIKIARESIAKLLIELENLYEDLTRYFIKQNIDKANIYTIFDSITNSNKHLKKYLKNIAKNVIKLNYKNMQRNSTFLKDAIKALVENQTTQNLIVARNAWKIVSANYHVSLVYIFSASSNLGDTVDFNINTWPINIDMIEVNIESWDGIVNSISNSEDKGLKAIEYLLFGDGETLESAEDGIIRLRG